MCYPLADRTNGDDSARRRHVVRVNYRDEARKGGRSIFVRIIRNAAPAADGFLRIASLSDKRFERVSAPMSLSRRITRIATIIDFFDWRGFLPPRPLAYRNHLPTASSRPSPVVSLAPPVRVLPPSRVLTALYSAELYFHRAPSD